MAAELPVKITIDLADFEKALADAHKRGAKSADQASKAASSSWAAAGKSILGVFGGLVSFEVGKKIAKELATATFQAEAFAKELKDLGELEPGKGTVSSLTKFNDVVTAGIDIGKAFVVEIGGNVADGLMDAAKTALAFGLAGLDAFRVWAEGKDVLHEIAEYISGAFFDAITAPVRYLDDLAAAFGLDQLAAKLEGGAAIAEKFAQEQTDLVADFYAGGVALNALGIDVDAYKDRIDALVGSVHNVRNAHKDLDKELHKLHERYVGDLLERQDQERELRSYEQAQEAEKAKAEKAAFDKRVKAWQDEAKAAEGATQMKLDALAQSTQMAEQYAQAGVDLAGAMFGETKEIKIAEAIINTASAVVSALSNPPGPPFSIPQAVAAGAMGAAQIATIASTNIAHSGLAHSPVAGMAPDETMYKLRKNEGVLTERGVKAAGGYQQVRRLNAGQAPSMGSSFVGITQFKHKMLDATIGPNIARPAAARTEIKAIAATGGRVGHRLRSNT